MIIVAFILINVYHCQVYIAQIIKLDVKKTFVMGYIFTCQISHDTDFNVIGCDGLFCLFVRESYASFSKSETLAWVQW